MGGDPYDMIVGVSVEEDVAFGLENLGLHPDEIRKRLTRALDWTGLSGMEMRLVHTLSGGEQQRLALAALLAMGARILVSDEAMNMLDRVSRASIASMVDALRKNRGLTFVHITNSPEDMLRADRLIFLSDGSVLFDGMPADFFKSPRGLDWAAMSSGLMELSSGLSDAGLVPEPGWDLFELLEYLFHHFKI